VRFINSREIAALKTHLAHKDERIVVEKERVEQAQKQAEQTGAKLTEADAQLDQLRGLIARNEKQSLLAVTANSANSIFQDARVIVDSLNTTLIISRGSLATIVEVDRE
jgi:hypothetical protein